MIRVVIVDDSPLLRRILKDILTVNPSIEVVGEGKNGKEAIELVGEKKPDVLILDCQMPVMDGLEALKQIMQTTPLPVFMFSALTTEGAEITVKALEYGAVDFMPKPSRGILSLEEIAVELQDKVIAVAGKPKARIVKKGVEKKLEKRKLDIIAIGSSTGGVKAAMDVIPKISKNSPPIVWAQHMPPNFTLSLAQRLNAVSMIEVIEANERSRLKPGLCLLAPGGMHMSLKKKGSEYGVQIEPGENIPGPRPSCDALFGSVSDYFTNNALGLIMTGMGSDGAKGLKKMHDKGALVIGQDATTSVVYGMAKSAYNAGAVDTELPLSKIATKINEVIEG